MRNLGKFLVTILTLHLIALVSQADLWSEVHSEIRGSQITRGRIAVSIRDAGSSNAPLVSAFWDNGSLTTASDTPMIPASNLKLLTTGAALHVLGPDFEFATRLLLDGDRLIVKGDGDPAFGDPELLETMVVGDQHGLSVEDFLRLWTDPVLALDLENIREIIIDDRIFEREFVHPTWPINQLNRRYCAEVSALNFHLNVLHYYPKPGRTGEHPDLKLFEPYARWLSPRNRATSRQGVHDKSDIWISRRPGSNEMTFYGNVKFAYRTPVPVTVHDMPSFFGRLLTERLREAGMTVGGYRLASDDDAKLDGKTVGPVIKTPIEVAITRCNRDSQNLYAESLLKRTSYELTRQPSTWATSSSLLRHIVHERLGGRITPPDLRVVDGSGLSRDNRISADTMTSWLNTFHGDERLGDIFMSSFAVARQSGTLKKRFKDIELHGAIVQAKSGYINEVSCLSGYVTMPDGRRRSFSILVNGLTNPGSVRLAKAMQEKIIGAIARDMAAVEITLGSD